MKRGRRAVRAVVAESGMCDVRTFDPRAVAAARRTQPNDHGLERAAECLGVLAHPSRLRLLTALDGRELCVCDCAQVLAAKVPATSQHLKELRRLGAITFRADGKMAYYRLADRRWLALAETAVKLATRPLALRVSA